jgi:hypothetical protein
VPSTTHGITSSSSSADIDAKTTTTASSEHRTDGSLKVLPLTANKANLSDSSVTVTSSTNAPTTVNSSDTKINPEIVHNEGTIEQIVNNDSDNQTNEPQTELVAGDKMEDKSLLRLEKEGRAINFNQNSTVPAHMQGSMNFVTTSTEKTHVISFFDLSDVSMDHDDSINENREMERKDIKSTTAKQTAINNECSNNGTSYKASSFFPY